MEGKITLDELISLNDGVCDYRIVNRFKKVIVEDTDSAYIDGRLKNYIVVSFYVVWADMTIVVEVAPND